MSFGAAFMALKGEMLLEKGYKVKALFLDSPFIDPHASVKGIYNNILTSKSLSPEK